MDNIKTGFAVLASDAQLYDQRGGGFLCRRVSIRGGLRQGNGANGKDRGEVGEKWGDQGKMRQLQLSLSWNLALEFIMEYVVMLLI